MLQLVGCGLNPAYAPTRQFVPLADQSNANVVGDKSRVYAIRPGTSESVFSVDVFDNDQKVGELGAKGYLSWDREPGPLHLVTELEKITTFDETTKDGETVFLLLGGNDLVFGDPQRVTRITKEDAIRRLARVEFPPQSSDREQWFQTGLVDTWYYALRVTVKPARNYHGSLQQRENEIRKRLQATPSLTKFSAVNIYLPLADNKTLVGLQFLDVNSGTYEAKSQGQQESLLHAGFMALSAIHYFPGPIGRYLFARVDTGIVNISHANDRYPYQTYFDDNGVDIGGAFGVTLPLGKALKLSASYDCNISFFRSGSADSAGFSLGLMW